MIIEAVREAPETPEGLNIRLKNEEDGEDSSNSTSVLLNEAVREAIVKARNSGEQRFASELQTLREELVLRKHALRVAEEAALDRDVLCDRVAELEIAKSNFSASTAESNAARMGMQKKLDEMQAQLVVVMKENASLMKALTKEEDNVLTYRKALYGLNRSAPPTADANANNKIMNCSSDHRVRSVSLSPQRLCVNHRYGVMMNGRDDMLETKRDDALLLSINNPNVEGDDSVNLKSTTTDQACGVSSSLLPPKNVDQKRIIELEQRLDESNLAVMRLEAEMKALVTQEVDGGGAKNISEWQQPPHQSSSTKQQQRRTVKTDYLDHHPSNGGGGEAAMITRLLPPPVRVKHRSFCPDGSSAAISEGRPLKLRLPSPSRDKKKKSSKRHGRLTITLGRPTYLHKQKMSQPSRLRIRDEAPHV